MERLFFVGLVRDCQRVALWSVAALVAAGPVGAQDNCAALLKHGIYNYYGASAETRRQDLFFTTLCSREGDIQKNHAGVTIPIDGVPVALTFDAATSMTKAMCSSQLSQNDLKSASDILVRQLSPEAIGAWSNCIAANSQGLRFTPHIQPYSDVGLGGTRMIVLDVDWLVRGGTARELQIQQIVEDGFTCTGSLKKLLGATLNAGAQASLSCQRQIFAQPEEVGGGNKVYARDASITVSTDAGSIMLQEPSIKAAPTVAELADRIADLERRLNGARVEFASPEIKGMVFGAREDTTWQFGRATGDQAHQGVRFEDDEVPVMVGQWDGTGASDGRTWNFYRLLHLAVPPPKSPQ